jgi:phosphohistidine swiveling domain-containing protein
MNGSLPVDDLMLTGPPASPLVEATLTLVHELVRKAWRESGTGWDEFCRGGAVLALREAEFACVEAKILQSGHRFAWSAGISLKERPDAYRGTDGAAADQGFSHPQAPFEEAGADGRALRGVGDNVVRHGANLVGTARFIRSNEQVLALLTGGVPAGTIAVIDDSGGTLTAPIIEQFAGVICAGGTVRSHLGILTREYNIPCLMNAKVAGIKDGERVEIEVSAPAKTAEDYQKGVERTARIWLAGQGARQ